MTHMSWYQRVVLFMWGCQHTHYTRLSAKEYWLSPDPANTPMYTCSDCGATRRLFEDWQAPSVKEGDK